jgi:hypothetical protein
VSTIDIGDMLNSSHAQKTTVASFLDEADYQHAPDLQVKRGPVIGPSCCAARVTCPRDAVVRVVKQRPLEIGDMMCSRHAQKVTVAAFLDETDSELESKLKVDFEEVD